MDVGEAWCGFCPPKRSEYLSEYCGEYLSEYSGEFCCGFLFLLSLCMKSNGEYCGEFCGGFSSRTPCRGRGLRCSRRPVPALALSIAAGHHAITPSNRDCLCSPPKPAFATTESKNEKARTRKSTKEFTLPRAVTESCTAIIIMSDPARRHPRPARILRCSLAPAARPSDNHWPSPTSHVISVPSQTSPN